MIILIAFIIIMSCYIAASHMSEETKTSYFISMSIFSLFILVTKFI